MREAATTTIDRGALHATPRELLLDVLAWDVVTWSSALTHWQQYTSVDLTRSSALVLGGLLDVTRGSGLTGLADRGLQGGLDGLVAQPSLLVGLDPLDLGLDVRHE